MKTDLYNAARQGAAAVVQPWYRGIARFSGPERVSWLQGMVSNDVEKLLPGQGAYAAHLNAQGKIVGQMTVLIDADELWLTLETSNVKHFVEVLDRMIVMEDVQSEDRSSDFESLAVIGPSAASVLETWLGEPLNLQNLYDHRASTRCRRIVRDELGYTLWTDVSKAQMVLEEILAAGATGIDEATWNILRIEAGLPLYGIDIDDTTTLPELGEKGIRYDKGCYIGQEVVARIKYLGHVNRRFMGFVFDEAISVGSRSVIQSGGKDVGYVTSSELSGTLGKGIALGFVNRTAALAGTRVDLISGEAKIAATVSELPLIPFAT